MALQTEYNFTLPQGYVVDGEDTVYKTGIMRLATAVDEILPQKDTRVQSNPAYLSIILLSRVIIKIDGLSDVNSKVIEGLFIEDLRYLETLYQKINNVEREGKPYPQY